ncbi:cyclic nucleotide-binding domain-containing protein 2-like [Tubulanus polymorphus]|uniref:cyclic nucleotide-binding domain-containing protein 2-like n=1 Tax=Tubulanus polymorphus TaxID=672921 RepID=UPI003DA47219
MSDIKRSDRDRKAAVKAATKVHFALRGTNIPTPKKRQPSLKHAKSTSTLITLVEEDDDVFTDGIQNKSKKAADKIDIRNKPRPILIWRKWARVVRMMCAVCSALRKYSRSGYIDLESMHIDIPTKRKLGVTQNEDGNLEEVSFNPRDFKRKAELTWPDYAKRVVEKRPDKRTDDELASIASLMRGLHSFRKYTQRMQYLLCRVVRYCNFNKKRVIVRKGHVGHSFYFIFSGAVSVVFDTDSDSIFVRPEVSILRKGEVFGEIALLKNTTRNASIVCFEDTELLAVDREDFMEHGLYDVMMGELQYRKEFLRVVAIYCVW